MKNQKFASLYKELQILIRKIRTANPALNELEIVIISLDNFIYQQKYFTPLEISYCKNRIASFAGRFIVKNAVNKILMKKIPWKYMEILPSQTRQPIFKFIKNEHDYYDHKYIKISITHEKSLIAGAVAVTRHNNTIAIGIDAAKISRLTDILKQSKILSQILTLNELKEINNSPKKLALIWSAKEAVSKALGIGIWHGASLRDIEITNLDSEPQAKLKGKLLNESISRFLINWKIYNISDDNYSISLAVAKN